MRKFFSRFAAAVVQAAPIGSLLALILFYIAVLSAELLRAEISVQVWLAALVALHVFSLAVMTLYIFAAGTHKYDSDIVGSSFVGFSKKCRSFDRALELHFNHRVTTSLDEFKLLAEEQSDRMTTDEKAIVSFYTGRCYEQLGFYPNALICYERAAEQAVALYEKVLGDSDSPFRNHVYVDIGRMYLDRNEPSEALSWFNKGIENRHSLPEAYGGAAIAQLMLGDLEESDRLYRAALVSHIKDPNGFTEYYKRILSSVMLKKDTQTALKWMNNEKK